MTELTHFVHSSRALHWDGFVLQKADHYSVWPRRCHSLLTALLVSSVLPCSAHRLKGWSLPLIVDSTIPSTCMESSSSTWHLCRHILGNESWRRHLASAIGTISYGTRACMAHFYSPTTRRLYSPDLLGLLFCDEYLRFTSIYFQSTFNAVFLFGDFHPLSTLKYKVFINFTLKTCCEHVLN